MIQIILVKFFNYFKYLTTFNTSSLPKLTQLWIESYIININSNSSWTPKMQSLVISNSVTTIGNIAFNSTNIDIATQLKRIGITIKP